MRYAIIDVNNTVNNLIEWDGDVTTWQPPEDCQAVAVADDAFVTIGATYEGGQFVNPQPQVPVPTVPQSVTMRQARLALLQAGKLADVNDAIVALPSPQREAAQIDWEFAATVDRHSPTVDLLAQALSLNDAALDELFTTAAGL